MALPGNSPISPATPATPADPGIPQDSAEVVVHIAVTLAQMQMPDLTTVDPTLAWQVMNGLLTDDAQLETLQRLVLQHSGRSVSLEDADPADFLYQSKEWGAHYMKLVSPQSGDVLIVMGNAVPQFSVGTPRC